MKGKRILLIEDEALFRTAVRIVMTRRGYEVIEAGDGDVGMQCIISSILEENPYDLILLDLIMPKVSGIDVIEYLIEEKVETPIMVITSMLDFDIEFFCSRLKNISVLQKPFSSKEFFQKLNDMLGSIIDSGGRHEQQNI
ncbi:MAG: response regulator [Deferribacterales bacterium]